MIIITDCYISRNSLNDPNLCRRGHDLPNSDDVVSVASEQVLAVSGPGQRNSLGVLSLSIDSELRLQLIQQTSLLKVEDLDTRRCSGSQPVSAWRERQSVDLRSSVQGVQSVVGVQVPQDDNTILAGGSVQGSIGRDSNTRDVTSVANEIGVKFVVVQIPGLIVSITVVKCEVRDLGD